jgi:hypothetical protein
MLKTVKNLKFLTLLLLGGALLLTSGASTAFASTGIVHLSGLTINDLSITGSDNYIAGNMYCYVKQTTGFTSGNGFSGQINSVPYLIKNNITNWYNNTPVSGDYEIFCDSSGNYTEDSRDEAYFTVTGTNIENITSTATHIISILPEQGTTEASTTINLQGQFYVNKDDIKWIQGITLQLKNEDNNIIGFGLTDWTYNYDVPATTTNSIITINSTITVPKAGNYTIHARINSNYLWSLLPNTIFERGKNYVTESIDNSNPYAQYHQYKVIHGTTIGDLGQQGAGDYDSIINGTTTANLTNCNPISGWDTGLCVTALFIPKSSDIKSFANNMYNNALTHFPWGYVTRFLAIANGSVATSSLPSLTATIPDGYPGAGLTINATPWGKLMGPGSYLATATSTQTGKTFVETIMTPWTYFVYFAFGLGICLELLNMNGTMGLFWGGGTRKKEEHPDMRKRNVPYKPKNNK